MLRLSISHVSRHLAGGKCYLICHLLVFIFTEYDERWKRCLSKTSAVLGFAMGALYVEKHFAEDNKKEVSNFSSLLDRIEFKIC